MYYQQLSRFKVRVSAGRGIRRSSSQICPASLCCRKERGRFIPSSVRSKSTAETSDWCWRPLPSTTPPFLDRRYRLRLCVWKWKKRWEEIDGRLGRSLSNNDSFFVFVCVCVTVLIKNDTVLCLPALVWFIRDSHLFSPLPSVSDWGEELVVISCSTWLG